ncbi:MAG TPA: hypothetical protein VF263_10605 [Longimicrobiaceae bacterium]
MSLSSVAGAMQDEGIIGLRDRPRLDAGGTGWAPDPGGSPASYRDAVGSLVADVVARLAPGEEKRPPGSDEDQKPTKDVKDRKEADGPPPDRLTALSAGPVHVIGEMVTALREIRSQA